MPSLSANDLMWLRILDCIMGAMGFALLSGVGYYALTAVGTGHRRLVLLVTLMLGARSINLLFAAYAIYVHDHHKSIWASTISMAFIIGAAAYAYSTRHDIVRTLRRSEHIDALWRRKLVNAKQVAMNVHAIAELTLQNVRKLG